MFDHNLEDFSQRLILGEQHFINSTSIFKRAMLTGYLSLLVIAICLLYTFHDLYNRNLLSSLYYLTLINFSVISFFLNRIGKYEFAKLLLLTSTLLIMILFSSRESIYSGNFFNLFPLTVAAFALFDYKSIHKGIIFTIVAIGLFLSVFIYNVSVATAEFDYQNILLSNFLMHFLISVTATVMIIVFLIRLNQSIESTLIQKDKNLIKTARKLKNSQQRFELALSGSNAGIYDWDIKNNVIYHSPMWKKLLNYQDNELRNFSIESLYEIVHPEDVKPIKAAMEKHLLNNSNYSVELRLRTKSGEFQWFSDSGQAVWDRDGNPVRMVGSIIKIHEKKVAEERIIKQNRMLEKTNLELDNFVYSASHDIRSPLTSILGLINIAKETEDKKEVNECLKLMQSRVNRLDDFIEDILDFSKNIRLDKKLSEINLYYFIEELLLNHDFGDQIKNLDIRLSLAKDFDVISDPLRLKVILKNITQKELIFMKL